MISKKVGLFLSQSSFLVSSIFLTDLTSFSAFYFLNSLNIYVEVNCINLAFG